jgi:hypothetical protein
LFSLLVDIETGEYVCEVEAERGPSVVLEYVVDGVRAVMRFLHMGQSSFTPETLLLALPSGADDPSVPAMLDAINPVGGPCP